jgi:VWFA-related protein
MRHSLLVTGALVLLGLPAAAQQDGRSRSYQIELEKERPVRLQPRGEKLLVQLHFRIKRLSDGVLVNNVTKDELVISEDGRRITDLEVQQPAGSEPLAAALAMDISGSMANNDKMRQAQRAAGVFLDKLPESSNFGLVLFDHAIRVKQGLCGKPERMREHRDALRALIKAAKPLGGTAYLDAVIEAVQLVKDARGRKTALLLTDGVDLNSHHSLSDAIDRARAARVPIYTIGVGEPGRNEPVTTVLVLDHSASMLAPAADGDSKPKLQALHEAAARFADMMRPNSRTSVVAFSDRADMPSPFSSDKSLVKKRVRELTASGETALFDAACDALETLRADGVLAGKEGRPLGKRALVLLTDGIDNRSRRRVEDVVRIAKESNVPLHVLGLGRAGELDEATMQRMAKATGGEYYPARGEQRLYEIFEGLSIALHDDGIDEPSLRRLAEETGGKYYPAYNVEQLQLRFQEVASELDSTYIATFPSRRPQHDGTARGIDIVVQREGLALSEKVRGVYDVHGVVVTDMSPTVYLGVLAALVGLLAIPVGLRRLHRSAE